MEARDWLRLVKLIEPSHRGPVVCFALLVLCSTFALCFVCIKQQSPHPALAATDSGHASVPSDPKPAENTSPALHSTAIDEALAAITERIALVGNQLQLRESQIADERWKLLQSDLQSLESENQRMRQERDQLRTEVEQLQTSLTKLNEQLPGLVWRAADERGRAVLGTMEPARHEPFVESSGLADPQRPTPPSERGVPPASDPEASAAEPHEHVSTRMSTRNHWPGRSSYLVFNGVKELPVNDRKSQPTAAYLEAVEFFRRRSRDPLAWQIHDLQLQDGRPSHYR